MLTATDRRTYAQSNARVCKAWVETERARRQPALTERHGQIRLPDRQELAGA